MHKTYKLVLKRLREDGFTVEVVTSKHYKVTYSKHNFKATQVISKTPSKRNAIIKGIAGFRKQLRAAGYTTLDNFNARLMTEYEVSKIIDSATERLNNSIDTENFNEAMDCVTVLTAVLAMDDECFENDEVTIKAHNEYLDKFSKIV